MQYKISHKTLLNKGRNIKAFDSPTEKELDDQCATLHGQLKRIVSGVICCSTDHSKYIMPYNIFCNILCLLN